SCLSTCTYTMVAVLPNLSTAVISMPLPLTASRMTASQLSPYASANPMKPSVLTLALAMASASALAISASFCGVLNTQRRLSSTGSTILALAATLIIGTLASAATSTMARDPGVIEVPTSTSTLSSVTSLREFFTAWVVSVASSSTIHSIFWPAASEGSRATVLRSGMPSEAAGPVLAMV